MATIPVEVAQTATKAINAYLASWKRKGSALEGARVETLETIEGTRRIRWLAHLSFPKAPGTFSALIFFIDDLGHARPEPGHRFTTDDLYPDTPSAWPAPLRAQGGQA